MTITLTPASLTFAELLHYERDELDGWERFFAAHPEALDFPFDPASAPGSRMSVVRGVVHHIVVVATRYCDRLEGVDVTTYEGIPSGSITTLFAAGRSANERLSAWIAAASEADLSRQLEFQTISAGIQRASARKVAGHVILHGVRTWAQIASVVRLHGLASGWHHDLLMSGALE